MPGTPTTKYSIATLTGTDLVKNGPTAINGSLTTIDGLLAPSDQGAFASRPTSTVGSPGKSGRTYYATDTHQLFRDNGSGWDEIPFVVPAKRVRATSSGSGQSIPSGAFTAVTFDAEDFDASAMHDNAVPTRLTCVAAGVYVVTSHVAWSSTGAGSTGTRSAHLQKNGGGNRLATSEFAADGTSLSHSLSAVVELAVSDYVETIAFQSQGAAQTISSDRHLAMVRISS